MKVALIGPPGSGKSTLLQALVGRKPDHASMVHSSTMAVPDRRLQYLAQLARPKKVTPATLEFWDFPGVDTRHEHGRQLLRKQLPEVRQCDVLVAVVGDFLAMDPDGAPAPQAAIGRLYDDFIFGDLEAVAQRIERLEHALRKPTPMGEGDKKELELLRRCQQALEDVKPLTAVLKRDEEASLVRSFAFLSEKPLVVVVNVSEDHLSRPPSVHYEHAFCVLNVCVETEAQIAELDGPDQSDFLADLGISEPAAQRLTKICYQSAGMISFLTATGREEVRVWPIPAGTTAAEAAGKIHSDMARGFIRAETVHFDDLEAAGGDFKAVKAAGKLRQEGKDYIVQDGDVIHFKFNV